MMTDELIITGDGGDFARLRIEGGRLVIFMSGGEETIVLSAVKVKAEVQVAHVEATVSARIDGGGRLELHADNVTRIDAGGVGITYSPTSWHHFYPWAGSAWKPEPPEHSDFGGVAYGPFGEDYDVRLQEYWADFPTPDPVMPED